MRFIQAAISDEDYNDFNLFAKTNRLTRSELIEAAIKEYIIKRKEVSNLPATKRKKSS